MSLFNKTTTFLMIVQFFFIVTIQASESKKLHDKVITIAIPIDEQLLIKNDPYFIYLKRAYRTLNIPVEFIQLPGARSFKMLEKGRISGSYPRYTYLSKESEVFINTPGFEIKQDIYAFSLQPIQTNDVLASMLQNTPQKIGSVRGIKIVETYVAGSKISLLSHIDHLINALQKGRVVMILETDAVMMRYKNKFTPLYRSQEAVIQGSLTQILHNKHHTLADRLSAYFKENPIN